MGQLLVIIMAMKQFAHDLATSLLAFAGIFCVFGALVIASTFINIGHPDIAVLKPRNSGLDDNVEYLFALVIAATSLIFMGLYAFSGRIKRKLSHTVPWIVAAAIECALMLTTMLEKHANGIEPQPVSFYAQGLLQVLLFIPLILGYSLHSKHSSKMVKK